MTRDIHLSKGSSVLLLSVLIRALFLASFAHASGHFSVAIQDLDGSVKGHTVQGLNQVKLYLNRFGYMGPEITEKHSLQNDDDGDHFDESLESALKSFQKYNNLKVTGKLDSATIKRMNAPRCGAPDNVNGGLVQEATAAQPVPKYHFFPNKPVWPRNKRSLSYSFNSSVKGSPMRITRGVFSYAFKRWEEVTKFKFHEASTGEKSDVVIGFHKGEHGDGRPFDGYGGIIAHSFSPTIGMLHLDADEHFDHRSPTIGKNNSDFVWVAMHEIGHVLGLSHSSEEKAVMYAYVDDGVTRRALHQDDIMGIHALYAGE